MKKNKVDKEILNSLPALESGQKNHVLLYIKSLIKKKKKDSKDILKFAGAFSKSDLKKMQAAIQEGCGNIDKNEW